MPEYAVNIVEKNFFTFGEVYADQQKISCYVGRHVGDGDLVGVDAARWTCFVHACVGVFSMRSLLPGR
jgi:hypothetical protein